MSLFKKALAGKILLSELETAREFKQWYDNRWKQYPGADKLVEMPSYRKRTRSRPRRRPVRRVRVPRRRPKKTAGKTKRFGRSQIGWPVGSQTYKAHIVQSGSNESIDTRVLNWLDLTSIPKTVSNDNNDRQRGVVNLRGWKIYFQILSNCSQLLKFNMAIISPKNDGAGVTNTDFFRDPTAENRAMSFSTAQPQLVMSAYPINTDLYTVLQHKRYNIIAGTSGGTSLALTGKNWRDFNFYVPLKRQLRFADASADSARQHVFLVFWIDPLLSSPGAVSVAAQATIGYRIHAVFKEPRT